MDLMSYKTYEILDTSETKLWQECRKRAQELGIPAWQLAEEGFIQARLDNRPKRR
jgi:hypothetical protein